MRFGEALQEMEAGNAVRRAGWNGKGMWTAFSPGCDALPAANFWSPVARRYAESKGGSVRVLPALIMKSADGNIVMGWLASQTDMLAEDWEVVPSNEI